MSFAAAHDAVAEPSHHTGARTYATSDREPVRLAAARGLAGLGDRARELRELELVGEDRRHRTSRRLPRVQRREAEVDDEERHGRQEAREEVGAGRPARVRRRAHVCAASTGSGAVSSTCRRTIRQGMPARSAALTTSVEPLGSCGRNAHEHLVRPRRRDRPVGLVEAADDADPEDPPPPHARVVVEEADHACVVPLTQLAREASARAAGADDEHALPLAAVSERLGEEPQREPRRADEHRAQDRVDDEDLRRPGTTRSAAARRGSRTPTTAEPKQPIDDRDDVARGRVSPHPAIDAERDEEDVARAEQDRQRGEVHASARTPSPCLRRRAGTRRGTTRR